MENVINVKSNIVTTENNSYRLVDNDGNQVGVVVFQDGDISVYHKDNTKEDYATTAKFLEFIDSNDLNFMSLASGNHRWKKYNPNPQEKNTGDCSIRAYCAAFNLKWDDAYDIASKTAKAMAELPDSGRVVENLLENQFGMHVLEEKVPDKPNNVDSDDDLLNELDEKPRRRGRKKNNKEKTQKVAKMTINEFAISHPFGIYVCLIHGHAVTIVDGEYWDSWDSGDKKISKIYTK